MINELTIKWKTIK